ncbi:Bacterial protein of unknown function (DUF899) domain containing protein [Hyaloscypha variabilis]|uniref:DUF899-domain-containing protein n=1 Tax=Hyaloscypha variabilis (strain UAMH 11265 / GT02V1 / F) TaxID=1149755 RepID=A0A2J6RW93_HYAVF|nr:hypothetical protein L207DRAFT_457282 [Hyaloscypha variabilis F]
MVATPPTVDRETFQKQLDRLRVREKAHTHEGDAIAAARRQLPMVEVDSATPLVGATGTISLLEAFEGRTQLFASYHMWHNGLPAADQCEGCTYFTGQALELSYLHSRDVTFAVFCKGPFDESNRYREFMGWDMMPWYSVPEESYARLDLGPGGHGFGMKACYLRDGDRVFETYWNTSRGCEPMGSSYGMLDMTVYGRQEPWEDSPEGWPQLFKTDASQFRSEKGETKTNRPGISGRPIPQWARLAAGHDDNLGSTTVGVAEECH